MAEGHGEQAGDDLAAAKEADELATDTASTEVVACAGRCDSPVPQGGCPVREPLEEHGLELVCDEERPLVPVHSVELCDRVGALRIRPWGRA